MTQTALLSAVEAFATALQMPPGDERMAAIMAAVIHLDAIHREEHRAELTDLQAALTALRTALRAHTETHDQALEPLYAKLHTFGNNLNELLERLNEQAEHTSQVDEQVLRALRELADIRQWQALAPLRRTAKDE